jgi:2C-methyl-D-erythritol 2,4-cyclodiphosphate synthase
MLTYAARTQNLLKQQTELVGSKCGHIENMSVRIEGGTSRLLPKRQKKKYLKKFRL